MSRRGRGVFWAWASRYTSSLSRTFEASQAGKSCGGSQYLSTVARGFRTQYLHRSGDRNWCMDEPIVTHRSVLPFGDLILVLFKPMLAFGFDVCSYLFDSQNTSMSRFRPCGSLTLFSMCQFVVQHQTPTIQPSKKTVDACQILRSCGGHAVELQRQVPWIQRSPEDPENHEQAATCTSSR